MKKQMKTALGLVGVIAAYYLISKGGAIGGGGGTIERFGAILGGEAKGGLSPLTSATAAGNMPGAKAAGISPSYAAYEPQKIFEGMATPRKAGIIPSTIGKTGIGKRVSPLTTTEVARSGMKVALPTIQPSQYTGASKQLTAGEMYSLGLKRGLTPKGIATKKKVAARQASGFVAYSGGQKGTAAAQKAAYKARSG